MICAFLDTCIHTHTHKQTNTQTNKYTKVYHLIQANSKTVLGSKLYVPSRKDPNKKLPSLEKEYRRFSIPALPKQRPLNYSPYQSLCGPFSVQHAVCHTRQQKNLPLQPHQQERGNTATSQRLISRGR